MNGWGTHEPPARLYSGPSRHMVSAVAFADGDTLYSVCAPGVQRRGPLTPWRGGEHHSGVQRHRVFSGVAGQLWSPHRAPAVWNPYIPAYVLLA